MCEPIKITEEVLLDFTRKILNSKGVITSLDLQTKLREMNYVFNQKDVSDFLKKYSKNNDVVEDVMCDELDEIYTVYFKTISSIIKDSPTYISTDDGDIEGFEYYNKAKSVNSDSPTYISTDDGDIKYE